MTKKTERENDKMAEQLDLNAATTLEIYYCMSQKCKIAYKSCNSENIFFHVSNQSGLKPRLKMMK